MSLASSDLGVLGDLAAALGLVNEGGSFNDAWLANPGTFLSKVLANEHQRESLVSFVDEVLGGSERTAGAEGTTWLPIVEHTSPSLTVYVVLDESPGDYVGVGIGVRVSTTNPGSHTTAHVPLFRAPKDTGNGVSSLFLLGSADAVITLATELTVDEAPPAPGAAHLRGVGLQLRLPTGNGGTDPAFALTLTGLQMPGASAPRDLTIDAANPGELDDAILELVLGIVQAQAEALPAGELTALAGLIGLRPGIGVPSLPVDDLISEGVSALASWLDATIVAPGSRAAWIGQLAALLGGTQSGDQVTLSVGAARVQVSIRAATGSGGHTRLTPTLAVEFPVTADVVVRADADLCTIDFGGDGTIALPRFAAQLVLGRRADGGSVLLDEAGPPRVRVETVRVGVAIDAERRPAFVLAADQVTIGSHVHETLDLSTPDAVADAGGTILGDVAGEVLDRLGPAADAVRTLLGFVPPAGHPGVPTLDFGAFLQDPLGAVAEHWQAVVRDHAAAIPVLITTVRDLVADAAHAGAAVAGAGTAADPWRVPIAGPVALDAWTAGDRLSLGTSLTLVTDTLGQRCTRVEGRLRVTAVDLDLAARGATFLPGVEASLSMRARGRAQAVLGTPLFVLTADRIGVAVKWTPPDGVTAELVAPNLAIDLGSGPLPIPIPTIDGAGVVTLAPDDWDAIEGLLGAFVAATGVPWLRDLVGALGWVRRSRARDVTARLRLSLLVTDPETALTRWLAELALRDRDLLEQGLALVANLVAGSRAGVAGIVEGEGRPENPWQIPLSRTPGAVRLAVWVGPDGPVGSVGFAPTPLQSWRPGLPGFDITTLVRALEAEAETADDIAALLAGRATLEAGLEALVVRWAGTDGRIVPPDSDPPGLIVHRLADLTHRDLPRVLDAPELLDRTLTTTVYVAVAAADALPWPEIQPDRIIDLTAPGLAPAAFTLPAPVAGDWFVALGGRDAARLASGDADGVGGQTERLRRWLESLASAAGGIVLVAEAEAGHAARRAAEAVAGVTDLILLGTPAGPVAFTVLDAPPAADTLRFLSALLPSDTDEISDDPDLAIGRGLIDGLMALLELDDPGQELQPPLPVPGAPRAGLIVHALFGVVTEPTVRRAITAVIAASLAERAQQRATVAARDPETLELALRVPLSTGTPASGDVAIDGYAQIRLATLRGDITGLHVDPHRSVEVHAGLGRHDGWLIGGPDPGRAPGARAAQELRRLSLDLLVPIGGSADATATLTLHEAHVFGVVRERWIVQPGEMPVPAGADAATPALPEVRVLLSGVADALNGATGPADSFAAALRALGLLAPGGGSVPDAFDHLLHDPSAHLDAVLDDLPGRQALVAALRGLFADGTGVTSDDLRITAGPIVVDVDLLNRGVVMTGGAAAGEFGLFTWSGELSVGESGIAGGHVTIGEPGATAAGGLQIRLEGPPLRIVALWHRPGLTTAEPIVIWPMPDPAALARLAARVVTAELARIGLEILRGLDESARPIVDAALGAVGLLGPAGAGGTRRVLLPIGMVADPAGWFRHETAFGGPAGFDPARMIAFVDAFKPLIGVAGGPGEWAITPGVAIRAGAGGAARLALTIDSGAFAPLTTAAGRLTLGGTFSLQFPPGAPARPGVQLFLGLGGAIAGRQAVHVALADGVSLFIRPEVGADIPIYPNSAGLGQLAASAVTQALPLVLDRLAGMSGNPGIRGQVGTLVARVGDGLGLRIGGAFSGPALVAWGEDPAAALAARLPALTIAILDGIADAIRPVLPGGAGADVVEGALEVQVASVTVRLTPSPFAVRVSGNIPDLPAIARVRFGIGLDLAGLTALDVEIGPADIDVDGVPVRPFAGVHVGAAPAGGRRVELSLGLGDDRRVGARWLLDDRLDLVVVDAAGEHTDPGEVALALLDAVIGIVAIFVLRTDALTTVLNKSAGSRTVRQLLRGVLLNPADPDELDGGLFDPDLLLLRLQRLASNLADAEPSIVIDGSLRIGLAGDDRAGVTSVGVRLSLAQPVALISGDVNVSLEADARWIRPPGGDPLPDGIVVDVLDIGPGAGAFTFAPSVSVNGVGLRFTKNAEPLLQVGEVSLGSIAVHLFGRVGSAPLAGGVDVQLSDLAVGVAGAQGGNPVAQGIMNDSGQGSSALAPRFSPALSVQKHGSGPVLVSLRAGDGTGPWWLAIQRGFGPLYIEQVGFGVTVRDDQLERISLLLDGRVSLLGLTAAVDDLQLTFVVASNASVFDPSRWAVDLAGLAITSDLGGIVLQGGLRKFGSGDTVQYVGMLMARFGVYGLSVFGGYGQSVQNGQRFSSFFAFGAINGPIGGPPAFFVTGIGGGLGINRQLIVPTDMSRFDQYPFIKALDPGARPSADPMAELGLIAAYFPQALGSFWFAAGLSFNSFALVDGVVVVSVQVGDGLQIALFGLARMALPRPEAALVSIELGLVARFSSKEGVLWVQAQLTDNSWLLYPDVRLTGGFAFVTWFTGPYGGQFVLTIGGYHPRFHRDGYPQVPRLGLQWRLSSAISVKGESYFALTSEAVMAGGRLEVDARFGPAWAHVVFGADGIVYFDPFRFEVEVYASISAGVTIDVWIGEITISIHIGARILVQGPNFRGRATFEVGPVELSVAFGDPEQTPKVHLSWPDFVRKYLEEASPGVARVLTAIPGKGALPPGTGPGGATDTGTADGSAGRPFEVFAEFELMVTSAVPAKVITIGPLTIAGSPSRTLGIAPMNIADAGTVVGLRLIGPDGDVSVPLQREIHRAPGFPVGVWGPPQPDDDRKVPAGDVIDAVDGVLLRAVADIPPGLPPIDYRRVETGPRHPLPFVNEAGARAEFIAEARDLGALLPAGSTDAEVFAIGSTWMARAGHSRTARIAMLNERAAPPRFGSLTDGLAAATLPKPDVALPTRKPTPPTDTRVHPPVAIAVLSTPLVTRERPIARTTVAEPGQSIVTMPPTLEQVATRVDLALPARLHYVAGAAGAVTGAAAGSATTIVAAGAVPLTRVARGGAAAVSGRGGVADARDRLASMTGALAGARAGTASSVVGAGEIAVLRLPNASRDLGEKAPRPRLAVTGGPARMVALGYGGQVLADEIVSERADVTAGVVPPGTERIAVTPAAVAREGRIGLLGWHAGSALPYIGWSAALASGATVRAEGASISSGRLRRTAGWVEAAELVAGTSIVITEFRDRVTVIVVALDDPAGTASGRGLSLGLTGATRVLDRGGAPRAARGVVRGNRTFLLYEIAPGKSDPIAVTVSSEDGWHLAGVMAGTASIGVLADLLATRGPDAVVEPVTAGATGSRTLTWVSGATPRAPRSPARPQSPRKAGDERGKASKKKSKRPGPMRIGAKKAGARKTAKQKGRPVKSRRVARAGKSKAPTRKAARKTPRKRTPGRRKR
jgi:hypothetical protein